MKVLVTGASGFLGGHIIQQLLEEGHFVVGVLRSPQKFLWPLHPRLALKVGDIVDGTFMEEAMAGCTHVIHAAATTSQSDTSYKSYEQTNVKGTEAVLKAAITNGVKRLVYVSTANTLGFGTIDDMGSEKKPMQYPFTNSWYALSKKQAEERVLAVSDGMETVTVHPTFMLGAYDGAPSSGIIILKCYGKRLLCYPKGGKNFVHVRDVAIGTIRALEKGENKASYLLSGQNLSYSAFFKLLAKVSDRKTLLIPIPQPILLFLGSFGSLLRYLGVPMNLSWTNAKILGIQPYYSNFKASQHFNMAFQPVENAIVEALEWFFQRGMLKKD